MKNIRDRHTCIANKYEKMKQIFKLGKIHPLLSSFSYIFLISQFKINLISNLVGTTNIVHQVIPKRT